MNTRPAWGALMVGALLVVVLFVSPIWLKQLSDYIEEAPEASIFPEEFQLLSNEEQDLYLEMYNTSPQMAIDFVAARLSEDTVVEEPNLAALDPSPGDVQLLLTGDFAPLSPIRLASGTVSLYRLSDGRRVLRLENLDATSGPDVHVLLSAYPNPATKDELDQVANLQIDLGPIKGNQGNQNYMIEDPAFNIDNYSDGSVVLFSTRYDIIFSFAALRAPATGP